MQYVDLGSRAVIGEFYEELAQILGGSWARMVGFSQTSDQESETYTWLGQVAQMREWLGGRHLDQPRDYKFTIVNKEFESTLRFQRNDLRRDKTGQIVARIRDLAARAAQHWEKLVSDLIIGNGLCYDGQNFFDTDHVIGDSGTTKNAITTTEIPGAIVAAVATPTPTELAKAITEAIGWFYTFKDDKGEPLNGDAKEFMVMVPAIGTYQSALFQALSNEFLAAATSNPLTGFNAAGISIMGKVNPRLTANNKFFIFETSGRVKPFILQDEEDIVPEVIGEGSEHAFHHKEHLFGVRAVRNAGYGVWHKAVQVTLATS